MTIKTLKGGAIADRLLSNVILRLKVWSQKQPETKVENKKNSWENMPPDNPSLSNTRITSRGDERTLKSSPHPHINALITGLP